MSNDDVSGSGGSLSTSAIANRLADLDIDVASSEAVSSHEERFSVVYEVAAVSGETYYVESLEPERASRFRTLTSRDDEIAVPIVAVLDGDPPLLVMHAARGRPLSTVLPIAMLPGVWHVRRDSLRAGIRLLGRNLARIHAAGPTTRAPYDDSDVDDRKLREVGHALDGLGLDADCQAQVRDVLADLRTVEMVHGMAHRDPSPHNVYYEDADITLIDLDLSERPVAVDVALADIGLELMAARLPYARASQRGTLRDALREGYGELGVDFGVETRTYRSVRIAQLCELLRNYAHGEVYSLGGRLTAALDPPSIRDLIREDLSFQRSTDS